MPRPVRPWLAFVSVACLGMGAGFAAAQSMTGLGNQTGQNEAQSLVGSQGNGLSAASTSATAASVPGATADTSAYQGLSGNPGGLASTGAAAGVDDANVSVVAGAYDNQASTSVSTSDAWFQSSLASTAAASSNLSTAGAPQQTCTTSSTQSQVTSGAGVYTCQTTTPVTDTSSTCVQTLVVGTTTNDDYACTNTYDQTSKQWVTSPACQALGAASQCTSTGSTCSAPPKPYFQAVECTQGTQWTGAPQSCSETRNIVIGTKYNYLCSNAYDAATKTWTTSAACAALSGSSACTQQSETCGEPTPPTTRTCQQGVEGVQSTETCTPTLQVAVGTDYIYLADKIWNGASYVPTSQETALEGANAQGTCQLQATSCTGNYPAQTYTCDTGTVSTITATTTQFFPMYGLSNWPAQAALTGAAPWPLTVGSTWLYSCIPEPSSAINGDVAETCAEFTAAGCTKLASATVKIAPNTNNLLTNNGPPASAVNVTEQEFSCAVVVTPADPQLAFPIRAGPGAAGAGSAAYYNDSALYAALGCTSTVAPLPAGVNDFTLVAWTPAANDNWAADEVTNASDYRTTTCTTSTAAPGCSPPTGYSETNNTCLATGSGGTCAETQETWALPGGCQTYQNQWLCNADVPAADPYQSTEQYVTSAVWSNACQALAANATCTLKSDVVTQGPATETIDGLAVTEAAWAKLDTYSCSTTAPVDTCTGHVTGCTQSAQSCAASDSNGNCTLWTYSYSCPTNDGSGGCEQENYAYTCTVDVPPADPAQSTSPYLISDNWTTQCQSLASDGACVLKSDTFDAAATKTIDGLAVTEPNWNQTETYTCWTSQPVSGCAGNTTGCTETSSACAGDDQNGNCSIWTYNYSCPANDGSGDCGAKTNTYTCTGSTPAAADVPPADPAVSSSTVVTSTDWNPASCPDASQTSCKTTGTVCNQGPSTQTVNGIQVTEACWQQTTNFTCEADGASTSNCNAPSNCTWSNDQCLDNPPQTSGCSTTEHVYNCTTTTTQTNTVSTCSTQLCMGSECFSISGSTDNTSLAKAYTALAIADQSGQSYSDPASNLTIFPGSHYGCHKAFAGFDNCCKDSGWGQDLGASCSETEKTLIQMQGAGECHYVGSYCSQTTIFDICTEETMSYCCYQGDLARIIEEAGHPQISKAWGGAKNPDCSGFTVAQFQSLDLSHVDFSQFYNQELSKLSAPDQGSTTSSITNTLQQLQNNQTPSNLTAPSP